MKYLNFALIATVIFLGTMVTYRLVYAQAADSVKVQPPVYLEKKIDDVFITNKQYYEKMISGIDQDNFNSFEVVKAQYATSILILDELKNISKQLNEIWKKQK